ncbi:hypothetical protein DPMN_194546 [Dreissena polymorpha]|uniref:Uncharacterized protein n=1 Tax=Dreissena polymorpha TaxID=45954 RepID=A0A9D3Y2N8_DREPO|nr:hypothetical protein DPMN_194546 [Dreissena polymorpha]
MRHVPKVWNAIWSDMFIETTFMRYGHGKKEIIGSTFRPETAKVWTLSLHIFSMLEEDEEMSSANLVDTNEQHNEEKQGRINANAKDK